MTYRPPPVRPSNRIFRVLAAGGRKRQAQAFFLSIAALCAAASANAAPGTVASKQAQAQQVLAQIQQIDDSLGPAIESYNRANVQLKKIESDQRENRLQLKLTRVNLKVAQDSLAARLVSAYTSTQDNTTLSVLLGAITSPTDAAAVFSVLRRVPLPRRLTGSLEAESGLNDAPTVVLVTLVSAGGHSLLGFAGEIAWELGVGVLGHAP